MHAQKHHRGAHRPPYLKAVKPTDQPRPGPQPGPEQKSGPTPRKASPAQEGRLAKLATFTTDLRMVLYGVALIVAMLIFPGGVGGWLYRRQVARWRRPKPKAPAP